MDRSRRVVEQTYQLTGRRARVEVLDSTTILPTGVVAACHGSLKPSRGSAWLYRGHWTDAQVRPSLPQSAACRVAAAAGYVSVHARLIEMWSQCVLGPF